MYFPKFNIRFLIAACFVLFAFVLLDSFYLNIVISGDSSSNAVRPVYNSWTSTKEIGNNVTDASMGSGDSVTQSPEAKLGPTKGVTLSPEEASNFILNTELCKIPKTPIMPAYFKDKWRVDKIPDCDYIKTIAEVVDDDVLELLPEYRNTGCCLREIYRGPGNDKMYNVTDCVPVEVDANTVEMETYVLQCNKSLKFEANMPVRPKVADKIAYWKTQDPSSRPLNVILVGFDTVSRSHAFRSIPKSMKLMEEMGFHDFVGYHSVAPSTLTNFMGFLMGLKRTDVRRTCTETWSTPFDSCPLIWKNYSQHNYVTMYLEDGLQTFNWGGQSGFIERPTDYYLHNFFNAVEDIRVKDFPYKKTEELKNLYAFCMSKETIPEFLTRYTKRFIRKFRDTPFFSFTWHAYPFHDSGFALASFDDHFRTLFEYLRSQPQILRNSLIVFNADHGERDGFFKSKGVEGYIERGLPPLFIRVPERLLEMYPDRDFNQVMRGNTQQMVSPFDLHHTFLHLLSLSGLNLTTPDGKEFQPVLPNRASLFVPIEETNVTRNCQNLNIFPDVCVCNTLLNIETIENPAYLFKIVGILQDRLRYLVQRSGYKKKCAEWTVQTGDIISAQVVSKQEGSTINLIRFGANPGGAEFEAKVKIVQKETNFDSCEIVGDLNRINKYGDQSSCVGSKTDRDKEMKAFCMCKSKVEKSKYGF